MVELQFHSEKMSDEKQTAENDFEFARRTYHDLINKGSEALDDMVDVARATEHPRAYEVLSNMMKNMGDINGSLLDLHKKKKDFDKDDKPVELPNQTTNNVFIGSTSDLQRMLLQDDEDKVVDISDYKKDE
jgi:hypothetical protein|tara:strand:+ start:618 stop:1010 length:393 start_codon:yes stop_codon:yes gene_type:complete